MISYIIMPFEAGGYLIRCINALYRQANDSFEVILGENRIEDRKAAESLERTVEARKNFKRISDSAGEKTEKIAEALKLVDSRSRYVLFLDVNTVVSPMAADEILAAGDGEAVVVPLAAAESGEGYAVGECSDEELLSACDLCGFCYPAALFGRGELGAEILEDSARFALFLWGFWLKGERFRRTEGLCLYQVHREPRAVAADRLLAQRTRVCGLMEEALESGDAERKAYVFEQCLRIFYEGFLSEDYGRETKKELFQAIVSMGEIVGEDKLLGTLLELYMGCSARDLARMDFGEYRVYRSRVSAFAGQKVNEAELERAVKAAAKEQTGLVKGLRDEMLLLKNDVAALAGNLYWSRQGNEGDMARTVPRLFGEGKLGFRVILKSISAWMKYKIRRKA